MASNESAIFAAVAIRDFDVVNLLEKSRNIDNGIIAPRPNYNRRLSMHSLFRSSLYYFYIGVKVFSFY